MLLRRKELRGVVIADRDIGSSKLSDVSANGCYEYSCSSLDSSPLRGCTREIGGGITDSLRVQVNFYTGVKSEAAQSRTSGVHTEHAFYDIGVLCSFDQLDR
jgi:hypothetical protein